MFTASNIDDQSAKQRNPITMYPNFRSYFIFRGEISQLFQRGLLQSTLLTQRKNQGIYQEITTTSFLFEK